MADSSSNLPAEFDLASELFHRINRIIPENQDVLTVPSDCKVRDAVVLMRNHGYSQLPVVENGDVLGVFSFRSFAQEVANSTLDDLNKDKCAPGDLTVADCLEQFEFARVKQEIDSVFESMDRDNGVLIGTPERLIGVLTPMDFLRYLYKVASPFVMVSEIELALRALIGKALTNDQIATAAKRCLAGAYKSDVDIPTLLEEMTFDNYKALVSHGENWPQFEPVFGGTRPRTSGKLKEIGEIRNALFHFRRATTMCDHQTLANHRNWLLGKVRQFEAQHKRETQP